MAQQRKVVTLLDIQRAGAEAEVALELLEEVDQERLEQLGLGPVRIETTEQPVETAIQELGLDAGRGGRHGADPIRRPAALRRRPHPCWRAQRQDGSLMAAALSWQLPSIDLCGHGVQRLIDGSVLPQAA